MEARIHATVNGHPCIITSYESGQDFKSMLGYEQIGDPFPCPSCGVVHSLVDGKWTNCNARTKFDEYVEAYEEVICAYCAVAFQAPLQTKTYYISGLQRRSLVLQCVELDWFEPQGEKCRVECGKLSALTGQYIMTTFRNHTATLMGYP